jgi:hypothetical protein
MPDGHITPVPSSIYLTTYLSGGLSIYRRRPLPSLRLGWLCPHTLLDAPNHRQTCPSSPFQYRYTQGWAETLRASHYCLRGESSGWSRHTSPQPLKAITFQPEGPLGGGAVIPRDHLSAAAQSRLDGDG